MSPSGTTVSVDVIPKVLNGCFKDIEMSTHILLHHPSHSNERSTFLNIKKIFSYFSKNIVAIYKDSF